MIYYILYIIYYILYIIYYILYCSYYIILYYIILYTNTIHRHPPHIVCSVNKSSLLHPQWLGISENIQMFKPHPNIIKHHIVDVPMFFPQIHRFLLMKSSINHQFLSQSQWMSQTSQARRQTNMPRMNLTDARWIPTDQHLWFIVVLRVPLGCHNTHGNDLNLWSYLLF